MRRLAAALALFLVTLFGSMANAQTPVPIGAVSQRAHITVNGGAMFITTGADWSGASLGGAVGYNLHPKFTLFGGYDHGFPINNVDPHLNLWRAVGNVRVHPNAFFGLGYAWFDQHTSGGLAQLLVSQQIAPRVQVSAMYAHIFPREALNDFEYARVFVNYHLAGKE